MAVKTLFATYIGIDDYPQHPLNGCIQDVLSMDYFFRQWSKQQPTNELVYNPKYFLAPDEVDLVRLEKYKDQQQVSISYNQATFKNISSSAFAHF